MTPSRSAGRQNLVVLRGVLTRPPVSRDLKSGDVVLEYDLSVPGPGGGAHESVNVVWFAAPASAADLAADTEVVVVGRVRRRFFRTATGTVARTEVVADRIVPARRAKAAERLVLDALADAEEAFAAPAA